MVSKSYVLYDPAFYLLCFLFLAHKGWKTTQMRNWNIGLQPGLCKVEEPYPPSG